MPEDRGDDDFASLLGDAKPLKSRKALAPRPKGRRVAAGPSEPRFVLPDPEDPRLGHASDCDARLFDELRRGRIAIDERVDLHGLRKAAAHEELTSALRGAWDAGSDCVLVVHGRGRSSRSEPVLKQALPGWLTTPPLAARVLAFAPARQRDGGAGASYVLLRPV